MDFNLQTMPKSQLAIRLFFEMVTSQYAPNSPAVKKAAQFCDNLINPEQFTLLVMERSESGPYVLATELFEWVIYKGEAPFWFKNSGASFLT